VNKHQPLFSKNYLTTVSRKVVETYGGVKADLLSKAESVFK
jgi:hypothetical protein